jgi:thiamine pyrophosphokinase
MRTVVVLSGGPGPAPGAVPLELAGSVRAPELVVAADGGLHLADLLGLPVDVVVGDMDSVDPERLALAEAAGATVLRHPADKDATDLELALAVGVAARPDRVVVVGSAGGRLDHLLGVVAVLASGRWAAVEVDAWLGVALVHVVRGRRSFFGVPGETVSLLAHGGPATGVTTTGLRWALDAGVLDPGSALGVSNVLVAEAAQIEVGEGCVVVVRPGPEPAPSAHPQEVGR